MSKSGKFIAGVQCLTGMLVAVCCVDVVVARDPMTVADRSVVRIISFKSGKIISSGTGFVVGQGGVVATNDHVLNGGDRFVVISKHASSGPLLDGTAIWVSPDYDLALLKVARLDTPPIVIAENIPGKGVAVTAIGFPGAADGALTLSGMNHLAESTLTQGIIGRIIWGSYSQSEMKQNVLQHSAAVNSGNSGGPLLDACARVVGVNTGKAFGKVIESREKGGAVDQVDAVYFASHVAELLKALKEKSVDALTTSAGCESGAAPSVISPSAPAAQPDLYSPTAIVAAISVAMAALFVALRKSTPIRETYTQYRRRRGQGVSSSDPPTGTKSWTFRGCDSRGRKVVLVVDAALLEKGPLIIGRDLLHCQLAIDDPTVSRKHARLSLVGGRLLLTDLDSTNGSSIDAEPITSTPIVLRHGQALTLGKVVLTVDRGAS